ncbi:MAG: hypothetical protein NTU80_03905 [Verrucomicrobia bacterium]|nr:hypothetical protein [Verrucomicrobiota bacterium]
MNLHVVSIAESGFSINVLTALPFSLAQADALACVDVRVTPRDFRLIRRVVGPQQVLQKSEGFQALGRVELLDLRSNFGKNHERSLGAVLSDGKARRSNRVKANPNGAKANVCGWRTKGSKQEYRAWGPCDREIVSMYHPDPFFSALFSADIGPMDGKSSFLSVCRKMDIFLLLQKFYKPYRG